MFTVAIQAKNGSSTYDLRQLRREARAASRGKGKMHAYSVVVHESVNVSLVVNYTQPDGVQTFTTVAL